MMRLTQAGVRVAIGALVASTCVACGGGGSTGAPVVITATATPVPTGTPVSTPTPTSAPTPTTAPTPSPSPTPTPLPAPALVPSQLSFTAVGSQAAQNLAAGETGYNGNFTATSRDCAGIVSFSSAPFVSVLAVTPIAAGTCTLVVADSGGRSTALAVSVTVTTVTGS